MKKVFCMLLSIILLAGCSTSQNMPTETTSQLLKPEISSTTGSTVEEQYLRYSPYVVTDGARQQLGEEYALYCSMVDAVVSYDGSVSGFKSEHHFVKMWGVLLNEFIPAHKLIQTYVNSDTPYTYHDGTVQFLFLNDRNEHEKYLSDFELKINQVLSKVNSTDSDVEIIAKLYEHVSYSMKYDMQYKTLYDCIMNDTGICGDYTRYLELLLNHAGIACQSAGGSGAGVDHSWLMAKIDGQWYHFDPTWESSFPCWYWFGVGDNIRHNSLVAGWMEAYIMGMGIENQEMDKSNLYLTGEWDYFDGKYLPPPECPSDFKPNSRQSECRPEFW